MNKNLGKKRKLSLKIMPILGLLFSLSALSAPNDPNLNQIDAQQQQRQQQQNAQRAAQLQSKPDVRLEVAQDSKEKLPSDEKPCFDIYKISLLDYSADNQYHPSQFQLELTKTARSLDLRLPRCIGAKGINALVSQVQNRIVEKGYVTTRVIVPEQNLNQGELVLMVIPGKIKNIIVSDVGNTPRFTRLHSWTGLTFDSGELLNLRDIEQSLENLKRSPTADANIEIQPSQAKDAELGDSDLLVTYAQNFPFRLTLGLDNSGSKSTGKLQGSATLSWDNLFSANDLFYASFTHSIKRHTDDKGQRASKNWNLYYSIPFGYWDLRFSHSQNHYHQELAGAFTNYIYSGESTTDKFTLSYMLYRDSSRKTSIYGSLWSRQSENYIDEAEIEVQRRRMAGWEAGINHREYINRAIINLGFNYKHGTGARGAIPAPEELWHEGTSRPVIMTATLSYLQPFTVGEQEFRFSSEWSAQWNKTPLIMQDRFSLGGRYTVRGFDGELTLTGERGWLTRNELSWNILGSNQWIYVGIDAGRVSGRTIHEQLGNTLVGSVLGVRGGLKGLYYDVSLSKPISKPDGFRTSNLYTAFNVGYSF
ncbi:hemolysin activation/secretion protein [Actinobacillus porcinus]|uniref:Hemolysin activation/secretion protein n=1 Tax=Actinobacillus porcinus TaxID=51048 RepID=A0ABY6TI05_9PAST|nr:ShlB/FhaC/HecB family hemolysin secretion/activation protein [Actinobacillus porcinus]VFY92548.1 hemolysin activation/secretion protein [Actinobacillus porcinus]VTU06550.1 hemolysin activation/secretion protein [Actinobacillus porcinus]